MDHDHQDASTPATRCAAGIMPVAALRSAVALAAGLHVSRIDGSPMVYNERDPWLPDFLVCRQEYAVDVLAALHHRR